MLYRELIPRVSLVRNRKFEYVHKLQKNVNELIMACMKCDDGVHTVKSALMFYLHNRCLSDRTRIFTIAIGADAFLSGVVTSIAQLEQRNPRKLSRDLCMYACKTLRLNSHRNPTSGQHAHIGKNYLTYNAVRLDYLGRFLRLNQWPNS